MQQAIAQGYQAKMQATATAYVEQEILLGQTRNEYDITKGNIDSLSGDKAEAYKKAQAEIEKIKNSNLAKRPETNEIRKIYEKIRDYRC